jgi:hypothetical protein
MIRRHLKARTVASCGAERVRSLDGLAGDHRSAVACLHRFGAAQSTAALPGTSDLDFLRDLDRIVNFDAKISNGAFDLRVAQRTRVIMHLLLTH